MKEKKGDILRVAIIAIILVFGSFSASALPFSQSQETARVIGTWQLVIDAEGEYYYLTMVLKETEGKLEGTISEASGFFQDVPLTKVEFSGDRLTFEFTAPTPPDGLSRLITADLKVAEDRMEGTISVPDLGITATATTTRQKL